MGSNSSKARSKRDQKSKTATTAPTTTTTATPAAAATAPATNTNTMSSSAQVPEPSQVPSGAAQPQQAAKSSSKTDNYFELIEVSHHPILPPPLPYLLVMLIDYILTGLEPKDILRSHRQVYLEQRAAYRPRRPSCQVRPYLIQHATEPSCYRHWREAPKALGPRC